MPSVADCIESVTTESGFSGVVQVDRQDGTEFAGAFGLAHRGFDVPNRLDTQFAVASGGKAFTALAVMSLMVEGTIGADTTARSVLGHDLPLIADDVTVGHLLAHRSGVGDYLDEEDETLSATDYVLHRPVHELIDTEAFVSEVDGHATKFTAGERFSYSNGGYIILAILAERASGTAYHQLVQERVIQPAGLTDTGFLRSDEPTGRMALGYLLDHGLWTNVHHLPVRGNGDGGIYTTADDMHRFWRALFRGHIVPPDAVDDMVRPHSDVPEDNARYGLGFWLDDVGPEIMLVGGDAGVSFKSVHDPTSGATWTVLSNTSDGAWAVARHMAGIVGFPR